MATARRARIALAGPRLCGCGCGAPTKISARSDGTYRAGEARKFLSGHQFRKDIQERIAKWTQRNPETGCLEWVGALSHGYGYVHYQGKPRAAHIVVYVLLHGELAEGLMVCHSCDNPKCCEPEHLFPGTNQDNVDDCVSKGRQSKGSKNGHAKLVEKDATDIRRRLAAGEAGHLLASEYCVSPATISMIRSDKIWRDL